MAGGKPSDADRFQPLTEIVGMPRPPVRMARPSGGSAFVDRVVEEISDSSGHHQNAASEVFRQEASGL
jgi:hypothetical protein